LAYNLADNWLLTLSAIKITDNFHCEWCHHLPTTKLTLFPAMKDEWDTDEGTGKSFKNAWYAQQYGKRHLLYRLMWHWTTKKIKPVVIAIVKLCYSEGICQSGRQAVSQSVENSIKYIFLKFRSNFLKTFQVDVIVYWA